VLDVDLPFAIWNSPKTYHNDGSLHDLTGQNPCSVGRFSNSIVAFGQRFGEYAAQVAGRRFASLRF
jgi:hypothetical protein